MTDVTTITCRHCAKEWTASTGPEGKGYLRSDIIEIGPEIAAHLRDAHGDEDAAIRMEKWVVTAPPWRTSTQK